MRILARTAVLAKSFDLRVVAGYRATAAHGSSAGTRGMGVMRCYAYASLKRAHLPLLLFGRGAWLAPEVCPIARLELKLCWLSAPEKELLSVAAAAAKGEVPGEGSCWAAEALTESDPTAKGLPLEGDSAAACTPTMVIFT